MRLWRRHGPSPSAVEAERSAQRQWESAQRQRAEAAPVVSAARESLKRNNYGEAIVAALQGRGAES